MLFDFFKISYLIFVGLIIFDCYQYNAFQTLNSIHKNFSFKIFTSRQPFQSYGCCRGHELGNTLPNLPFFRMAIDTIKKIYHNENLETIQIRIFDSIFQYPTQNI